MSYHFFKAQLCEVPGLWLYCEHELWMTGSASLTNPFFTQLLISLDSFGCTVSVVP